LLSTSNGNVGATNYCDAAGANCFSPATVAGGGTAALNGITSATAANTALASGDYAQVWNWSLTTAGKAAFTLGESAASTATGSATILQIKTLAASTAIPLTTNAGASKIAENITVGGIAFGGTNVLAYPDSGLDTTSLAVGPSALVSETAANGQNTAVGVSAGQYISTGVYNTAVGTYAMQGVSGTPLTGDWNTAVGQRALFTLQGSAQSNTAVGEDSLHNNSTGSQNTAVGDNAMIGVSGTPLTGSNNVAVGYNALFAAQGTASDNTALGMQALYATTTGTSSTAVGYYALDNATGSPNDALGFNAGKYISTGSDNVALGYQAMTGISGTPLTGSYNTAVGDQALYTIQGTASNNTAVGYQALGLNTTGSANTAIGQYALTDNITGIDSSAIGVQALYSATGSPNDALGYDAGEYITTGTANVAIGYHAIQGVSGTPLTGNYNTAVGDAALDTIQGTAAGNTAVGYQAGYSGTGLTTGTNNVYIGYNAAAYAATDTNEIVLGEGTTGNGSNTITLGNASITKTLLQGNVGINNPSPGALLDMGQASTTTGTMRLESGGSAYYTQFQAGTQTANATYTLPPAVPGTAGYVLSSDTSGNLSWISNAGTASTALSGLMAASAANTITNGTNAQVWEWALTGQTGFTFGESAHATGASKLVDITTLASSTAVPLTITNGVTASTNPVSINMTAGALAIGGVNVLELPHADTTSIAVGESALQAQSGITYGNTAVGGTALNANTSGVHNTAIGYSALLGNTTGIDNTAIGNAALHNTTTAGYSTAVGAAPLFSATGGPNDALGYYTGYYITSGTDNVALGYEAMMGVSATPLTGSYNTAVGNAALQSLQGGAAGNVALGYQAGYSGTAVTTGTNNVFIGYNAAASTATDTNEIVLGEGTTGNGSNTVTLGNSSVTAIYAHVTSITSSSDRRLKKDIEPTDLGLDFIDKLRPVSFRYNNGDDTLRYGFIAQETEEALPKPLQALIEDSQPRHGLALIVHDHDKGSFYNMGYGELLSPIVKSVQQLETIGNTEQKKEQDDVADLEKLIAAQQKEIADLHKDIANLKAATGR
jgi:trimeric autotransporter adhesin